MLRPATLAMALASTLTASTLDSQTVDTARVRAAFAAVTGLRHENERSHGRFVTVNGIRMRATQRRSCTSKRTMRRRKRGWTNASTSDCSPTTWSRRVRYGNVIMMDRQHIRSGRQLLKFVTDRKPTFARVDPYNFYIDRNAADNIVAVGPGQ